MAGCGTHYYGNLSREKVDAVINELKNNDVTVTGNNPWDADTHQSGVKIRAEYLAATMTLAVTVVDSDWYAPCSMIWDKIDPLMHHIQEIQDA